MLETKEIANEMYKYGHIIHLDSDSHLYPIVTTYDKLFTDGLFIYTHEGQYHYIGNERGKTVKTISTDSTDMLFFYVFKDITFQLAQKYELENRNENEDFRRILFGKQLELLNKINPDYATKRVKEIEEILARSPYRDNT